MLSREPKRSQGCALSGNAQVFQAVVMIRRYDYDPGLRKVLAKSPKASEQEESLEEPPF
jgi:hypothetical protein